MAKKINAVLHEFVDENDVSSSDEDIAVLLSLILDLMSFVMLFVLMENMKIALPVHMGGADADELHGSKCTH